MRFFKNMDYILSDVVIYDVFVPDVSMEIFVVALA